MGSPGDRWERPGFLWPPLSLTAGPVGIKGWGLQEGTGACRERRPFPGCRSGYGAGRGKNGNEHPPLVNLPGLEGEREVALGLTGKGPGAGSLERAAQSGPSHPHCGRREGRDGQLARLPGSSVFLFTDT